MYYIDIKRATVKQSDFDCIIVAAEQAEPEKISTHLRMNLTLLLKQLKKL